MCMRRARELLLQAHCGVQGARRRACASSSRRKIGCRQNSGEARAQAARQVAGGGLGGSASGVTETLTGDAAIKATVAAPIRQP